MNFVKFVLDKNYGDYSDKKANNIEMCILGRFLSSDVRFSPATFKEWGLDDLDDSTSSNITALEKENGYVYLSDLYSEEEVPTKLKMTVQQFVQLLDDWQEKVCKAKPQEVIIKHENGEFVFETKE